jgi:deoxyuridine 5'-triphosphate nucleotidohydrolase
MNTLRVVKLLSGASLPTKTYDKDLCWDFYLAEDVTLEAGQTKVASLGVAIAVPDQFGLIFKERSGLASKGLIVGAGVIDSTFRGELKVVLRWLPPLGYFDTPPDSRLTLTAGSKIVQGYLQRREDVLLLEVESLEETDRGERGFGSTGV